MINVKLIVILFNLFFATKSYRYCEICPEHVLCQFAMAGPSVHCTAYDPNSLLKNKDIDTIVKRINEKRNFIASGVSRYFPQAANMNKIYWSDELAAFAQRWVDQCDPNVHPDKEDECRDIDGTRVGQNIVSVVGPSPGMIIQSLIDVWFTQGLGFSGNLSHYNHLKDYKTNYFTQLIWGDTERVGCGKAKFYLKNRNAMIERLVCNFAPKGNIQGKPVYALGFPATQCKSGMSSDNKFAALCGFSNNKEARNLDAQKPARSLLRILNLSTNLTKEEIKPLSNNLKEMIQEDNIINQERYQKIRHVAMNNNSVYLKKLPEKHGYAKLNIQENNPISHRQQSPHIQGREYVRERNGHVLHASKNYNYNKQVSRRMQQHSFTRVGPRDSFTSFNKNVVSRKCTRKLKTKIIAINELSTCYSAPNRCTRKHMPGSYSEERKIKDKSTTCKSLTECTRTTTEEQCSCNTPPKKCQCNNNCQCLNMEISTQIPQNVRLNNAHMDENNNPGDNFYYDLFPIVSVGSNQKNLKTSDSKDREKRKADEITFRPFWQMDEFDRNRPLHVKALKKYTTLSNKKHRKTKQTMTSNMRIPQTTEKITVKLKHASYSTQLNPVTEKYLSFDELMHLRKYGSTATTETIDGRRNEPNATAETTEYTTNTPFARKKHCTRKLTCTWTAASFTDANGSVISPGGNFGSRTPPGYVEGCTRTSTCTRENMNRNKFSTLQEDGSTTAQLDEDYCEKRALNIRKRDSQAQFNSDTLFTVTILPIQDFTKKFPYSKSSTSNFKYRTTMPPSEDLHDDFNGCRNKIKKQYFNSLVKNTENLNIKQKNKTPYGESFYLFLENIIRSGHDKISSYSSSATLLKGSILLVLFIYFYIIF